MSGYQGLQNGQLLEMTNRSRRDYKSGQELKINAEHIYSGQRFCNCLLNEKFKT